MTDNNQSVYLKVLEILPKAWHGYENAKEIVISALQIAHFAQSDNHYAYMAGYEAGDAQMERLFEYCRTGQRVLKEQKP